MFRSNETALHLTVQNKPFFTRAGSIGCLFNIFNLNIFVKSLHFQTARYVQFRYFFTWPPLKTSLIFVIGNGVVSNNHDNGKV